MAFNFANLVGTGSYDGESLPFRILTYTTTDNLATATAMSYWEAGARVAIQRGDIIKLFASDGNKIGLVHTSTFSGASHSMSMQWALFDDI